MNNTEFINVLDSVLLSENVLENFKSVYNNNFKFKSKLLKFLPEIEKMENLTQRGIHHIFNVLDHTLVSVDAMNKNFSFAGSDKRALAYAMLLHDVGKAVTHKVTIKDGKEKDIFYGHPVMSEKIARQFLQHCNFNQQEINEICFLVESHDLLINFTCSEEVKGRQLVTKNSVEKMLLTKLSNNNLENAHNIFPKFIAVSTADSLAQNPAKEIMQPKLDVINAVTKFEKQVYENSMTK